MVRAVDDQTASPRRFSQCAATQSGDSGLHRCASGESEAVRLDQDCRRDSGQHRAIRRAHRRRAGHTTSVTNHRDGTLAHVNARDTSLVYASRAPQADIARLKARMGWEMPWYTITDGFDADFG